MRRSRIHANIQTKSTFGMVRTILYWLTFTFAAIAIWLRVEFGTPGFEQILYHMQFGAEGIIGADKELFISFALWSTLLPIFITFLIFLMHYKLTILAKKKFICVCFVLGFGYFTYSIAIFDHLVDLSKEDYVAKYYVEPQNITSSVVQKNLILIYVESLENSYSDLNIFNEDLLLNLNRLPGQSFSSFKQTKGTGWTMAGIISTMCGIPLKPRYDSGEVLGPNIMGEAIENFLPNIICLGDVLHTHGYRNVFVGGSSLDFAGKGKFLRAHGYDEVIGKNELAETGKYIFHNWGLHDDALFELLKNKVDILESEYKPYNLTTLTLDTHHPKGHISPYCKSQGVVDYRGIVRCTADLIQDFVMYLEGKGYLEHTQVIILGDHLSMKTNVMTEDLDSIAARTVYNKFILVNQLEKNREEIVHFDLFPTILYTLDFEFPDNKLALGVSAFGSLNEKLNVNRFIYMDNNVMSASAKYVSFWENPS